MRGGAVALAADGGADALAGDGRADAGAVAGAAGAADDVVAEGAELRAADASPAAARAVMQAKLLGLYIE